MTTTIHQGDALNLPIPDNTVDLVVTSPGLPEQRLPLVAAADVGEASFFGRIWAGLLTLFGA